MKKIFFIAGFLSVFVMLQAQSRVNRQLSTFDKVEVAGDVQLELTQCGKEDVTIVAREVSADEVITEISGRTLKIKLNPYKFSSKGEAKVYLNFNKLREIGVEAGAEANIRTRLKADYFKAEVSGGGSLGCDVDVNSLELRATQAAKLTVSGRAASLEAVANTGGEIKARELQCEDAVVKAHTGASIAISVSKSIEATAGTGGSVYYKGDPAKESTTNVMGGTITRER